MSQPFTLPAESPVMVGGSRSLLPLQPSGLACSAFVHRLASARHPLRVGCATGADAIALQAGSFRVHVYTAFNRAGEGSFSGSNVAGVLAVWQSWPVHWLAGGPLTVPLVARLMARSIAALANSSAAVFFAPGLGSLKVARAALRSGLPVLVSRSGLQANTAPVLPLPSQPVEFLRLPFWLYQPGQQAALF